MINLLNEKEHTNLVSGELRDGTVNRLTVSFIDGSAIITCPSAHLKDSISQAEFDGDEYSVNLPEVVFSCDMEGIKELLEPAIIEGDWSKCKKIMDKINEDVDFYGDYIDGSFEDCETDEQMEEHIKKHGFDAEAIQEEILRGGCEYVSLKAWIENYIERRAECE